MGKHRRTISVTTDRPLPDLSDHSRIFADHLIEKLESSLADFNKRIAELEGKGRESDPVEVLKATAMDLARQVDEVRCFLLHLKQVSRSPPKLP